jgi:hypothetical protein
MAEVFETLKTNGHIKVCANSFIYLYLLKRKGRAGKPWFPAAIIAYFLSYYNIS